ncbi:hypothetical protein ACFQ45_13140 [Rhodanobacter aciditrophus]|uniref:Uncharacterized protein n=1 Tax=Rhodanobacter aciditrophus TaxID=1623218 RepID=A0ABW4B269_9GAMM
MDPMTMAAASQMAGFDMGGLNMGGGSIAPSSSASNQGGTNTVGGAVFGNYNPAATTSAQQNWVPWVVGGAVALSAVLLMRGGK